MGNECVTPEEPERSRHDNPLVRTTALDEDIRRISSAAAVLSNGLTLRVSVEPDVCEVTIQVSSDRTPDDVRRVVFSEGSKAIKRGIFEEAEWEDLGRVLFGGVEVVGTLEENGVETGASLRIFMDEEAYVARVGGLQQRVLAAAAKGDVHELRLLLDNSGDPNQSNMKGATPIFFAARGNHVEALQLLLEHRAEVNGGMRDGATAVFIAAQEGSTDALRILLEHGGDATQAKCNGATPTIIATEKNNTEALAVLQQAHIHLSLQIKPSFMGVHAVEDGSILDAYSTHASTHTFISGDQVIHYKLNINRTPRDYELYGPERLDEWIPGLPAPFNTTIDAYCKYHSTHTFISGDQVLIYKLNKNTTPHAYEFDVPERLDEWIPGLPAPFNTKIDAYSKHASTHTFISGDQVLIYKLNINTFPRAYEFHGPERLDEWIPGLSAPFNTKIDAYCKHNDTHTFISSNQVLLYKLNKNTTPRAYEFHGPERLDEWRPDIVTGIPTEIFSTETSIDTRKKKRWPTRRIRLEKKSFQHE